MSERKMQAAILGAESRGKMVYYCRECGNTSEPCHHITAYSQAQVREREAARQAGFDEGERRHDIEFKRRVG